MLFARRTQSAPRIEKHTKNNNKICFAKWRKVILFLGNISSHHHGSLSLDLWSVFLFVVVQLFTFRMIYEFRVGIELKNSSLIGFFFFRVLVSRLLPRNWINKTLNIYPRTKDTDIVKQMYNSKESSVCLNKIFFSFLSTVFKHILPCYTS